MLKIDNLHASVEDKGILKGINLEVKAGEVHAIMGPNGSGKSTLASVIAGKEEYEVTDGSISFNNEDIDELAAEVGLKDKVATITAAAMRGEIEFDPALRERVSLLKGLPESVVDEVIKNRITLTPGGT